MADDTSTAPSSDVYRQPWRAVAGWFLGPRAENRDDFNRLAIDTLNFYEDCRESYYPADPEYVTTATKSSRAYRGEISDLEECLKKMNNDLKHSIPFFSPRYKGHMCWEVTMPSFLGYMSGMLWNQNNVDSSASPVTTRFELQVGRHLCEMLGFSYEDKEKQPWGHITCGGTVANIEALWAARNLKFHPLALQRAIKKEQALKSAKKFEVYIPARDAKVPILDCTTWELLNLDVDDVCSMSEGVKNAAGVSMEDLTKILESYTLVGMGCMNFMKEHHIKSPVFCSPATNHYSWPKAATILGLGDQNLIPVPVDKDCRQNIEVLKTNLEEMLNKQIPVLMVVAVIGSTEESAVDSLHDIWNLREKFRKKGLNFCIHSDAAWGGYLTTMIREPSEPQKKRFRQMGEDFVPSMPLSDYVKKQYHAVRNSDTVTIDPHKAGFCLYPSGALCYRNGSMRGFITLAAPEVYHGSDDESVGVYGIEGSKPGAAAASVLLSHNVIGLDKLGYGRILGQCTLGTKLFYCMWAVVAKDNDPFICLNLKDFPSDLDMSENQIKNAIKERILGKPNEDLFKDKEVMKILTEIGPDALINTFVVNFKDKKLSVDINAVNDLQSTIFNELTGTAETKVGRTPMFLTTSTFNADHYGEALMQFKERLGLPVNKDNLNFLRNTIMNPFQSGEEFVVEMGSLFRTTVLNSIGKVTDPPTKHEFVTYGKVTKHKGLVFCDYLPNFTVQANQYHVIINFKLTQTEEIAELREHQKGKPHKPFVFRTKTEMTLFQLLREKGTKDRGILVDIFEGFPAAKSKPIMSAYVKVEDVVRFSHFEPQTEDLEYPEKQKYFIFGDHKRAYLSHIITKNPDFHQGLQLDEIPHSVPLNLLDLGFVITIPELDGKPLIINGEITDPLQRENYVIHFRSTHSYPVKSEMRISKKHAKRWFDGKRVNGQV